MARPSTSLRLRITGPGIDVGPAPDSPHPERSRRARDVDAIPVATTSQQAKRVEMIHTIQRMILEDAPQMFLYTSIYHVGVQPWVQNYTVPINAYDQRYEAIWIDKKRS